MPHYTGKDVEYTAPALIYSSQAVHGGYGEHIQGAYLYASNLLLQFLIVDHDLKGKLQLVAFAFTRTHARTHARERHTYTHTRCACIALCA